jgi:hypothetical protein
VDLYPLQLPDVPQPDPVDTGWARRIRQGPRTIEEVLHAASARMDAEDEAEAYWRDPVAWVRAHRPRRLWDVLLGRR